MTTAQDSHSDPDDLGKAIGAFLSVNEELARLRETLVDLESSSAALKEAREGIAEATQAAAQRYEDAATEAKRLIASAVEDHCETLAGFHERLEAASEAQRTAASDLLARIHTDVSKSLDAGQQDLRDTASKLQRTIDALRGPGRDLADTASAFRKLEPERMQEGIESLQKEVGELRRTAAGLQTQGRIAIALTSITLLVVLLAAA